MIQHPYVGHGAIDHQALDAAQQRAEYYGMMGVYDPRTYTIDPLIIRRVEKQPWKVVGRMSLHAMVVGVAFGAALGYMGYDPLNVTPGYGMTPGESAMTIDGVPVEPSDLLFDLSQLYM
jgi:hypothetical protein